MQYTGDLLENQKHGKGVCVYPDGSTYDGEWKHDKRCGFGTETTSLGTYTGEWKDDKRHGKGTFKGTVEIVGIYQDGNPIFGEVLSASRKHKYIGDLYDKKLHGKGIVYLVLQDGTVKKSPVFEGEYKQGKKHGHGKSYYEDGTLYFEGEFQNDSKTFGTIFCKGRLDFQSQWKNGKNEQERLDYVNQSTFFKGEFRNSMKWRGQRFVKGETWYEGYIQNDKNHGFGISFRKKIKEYEGEWSEGKYHGVGIQYNKEGKVVAQGVFQEGKLANDQTVQVIRKFANGDIFKLIDAAELLWFGRHTVSEKTLIGTFKGLLRPAPVIQGLVLEMKSTRMLETYDNSVCTSSVKFLEDWTMNDTLGWVQSHLKKGHVALFGQHHMVHMKTLVIKNKWSGNQLMQIANVKQLEQAGVISKLSQNVLMNLIEEHRNKMNSIQKQISEFPEALSSSWPVTRLLWVSILKNNPEECPMAALPRDIIRCLMQLL